MDGQPQRMDCLEREPKLRAGLSFLERDHPESAGADALRQFVLRNAGGVASLADEGTNDGCIEVRGHVGWMGTLMIVNIAPVLTSVNFLNFDARQHCRIAPVCLVACEQLTRNQGYTIFCVMRNVTVTLGEDVARLARIRAAELDVSSSRMLGDLLEEQMRWHLTYETELRQFLVREHKPINAEGSAYPSRDELHDRTGLR